MSRREGGGEKKRWREEILLPALARHPERKDRFLTSSGIEVEGLYTPEDLAPFDYDGMVGYPGQFPYTRGVQPTMYRGRLWTMRQYAGYGTAAESNRRYKYLLEQGQTGLSVAFDLPTQVGYDSDHPLSQGEVGRTGVAIDSLQDMEALFDGIPLGKVSTSMTINATAPILLAMYVALARQQGVPLGDISGTTQNDILKEYMARGTYIYPPKPSMRLVTDIFEYCAGEIPRWNTISISGYHIREAGATAVQELAFTLADGIAYVDAALSRGLKVDDFAPRLSFFFNAHSHLFEEVAKFRAARRMWATILRDRFGARNPRSRMLRFHTQTAGSTLTAQQSDNNVVRVALQALAAVLGGTQSLHTNSRDEAISLPTEDSVQIALRTQQILAHEAGIADTADPLGGSYFVERLTNQMEERAWNVIEEIDGIGGAVKAVESGYFQRAIQRSAYEHQQAVERKERIVIGLNEYVQDEPEPTNLLRVDPLVQREQESRLKKLRRRRDQKRVSSSLIGLRSAAQGVENLIYPIIECVESYATVGEISDVLRGVFGEHREEVIL